MEMYSNCQVDYESCQIELCLIDILNRKIMGYVIQDVLCTTCSQIKQSNINMLCTCSGTYKTLISKEEIQRILKIFRLISNKSQMFILNETVEFLLTGMK